MVALTTFWGIYCQKDMIGIVNNASFPHKKRKIKTTEFELKAQEIFSVSGYFKNSSRGDFKEIQVKKAAEIIEKEILQKESNISLKKDFIEIGKKCVRRRDLRVLGRV